MSTRRKTGSPRPGGRRYPPTPARRGAPRLGAGGCPRPPPSQLGARRRHNAPAARRPIMTMIINPGSHIGGPGEGWTNTVETARATAVYWLSTMRATGMTDVGLLDGETEREGRWVFTFRHAITGTTVELEIHGIDNVAAYEKKHIFAPRAYWNGSSTSEDRK